MSYSDLSPNQLTSFWMYVRGDSSDEKFEEWLYKDAEIEEVLGSHDYLEAISVDFRQSQNIADFKAMLAKALPSLAPCSCHTKPNYSFVTLGDWSTNDFELAEREIDGLFWLHRLVCKTCGTNWMVAEEGVIYDVRLIFRGIEANVSAVSTYHGLLKAAANTGAFFGYADPMNSIEIPIAIKSLIEETPNIPIDEIIAILPVPKLVVEHHIEQLNLPRM